MLNITITNEIMEIEEVTMSFFNTVKKYSYWNVNKNIAYMHPAGKKINPLDISKDKWWEMTKEQIDWMHIYHIPKAKKKGGE